MLRKYDTIAINSGDLAERLLDETDGDLVVEIFGSLTPNIIPGDWYVVKWPDHVICPRYNGDATYSGPMSKSDARSESDWIYFDR